MWPKWLGAQCLPGKLPWTLGKGSPRALSCWVQLKHLECFKSCFRGCSPVLLAHWPHCPTFYKRKQRLLVLCNNVWLNLTLYTESCPCALLMTSCEIKKKNPKLNPGNSSSQSQSWLLFHWNKTSKLISYFSLTSICNLSNLELFCWVYHHPCCRVLFLSCSQHGAIKKY